MFSVVYCCYVLICCAVAQWFSICGTRTTGGTRTFSSGTRSMNDFFENKVEAELPTLTGYTSNFSRQNRRSPPTHRLQCAHSEHCKSFIISRSMNDFFENKVEAELPTLTGYTSNFSRQNRRSPPTHRLQCAHSEHCKSFIISLL